MVTVCSYNFWVLTQRRFSLVRGPSSGSSENIRNRRTQAYIGIAQGGVDQLGKKSLGRKVIELQSD